MAVTRRLLPLLIAPVAILACGGADNAPAAAADTTPVDGRQVFVANCQVCHGEDGRLGLNGAKDLTTSTLSKPEMAAIVKFGRNTMTPFRHILSTAEIDAVVEYVRTMKQAE